MARMPVLSTDTCFKNGSSFDICLAIYLVGQLGNLEPLVQLGKLLQLVLLQPFGIGDDKSKKGFFTPCRKLVQLGLHLHHLLQKGEHGCRDHLKSSSWN